MGINAKTEWLLSIPTRQYHVDPTYSTQVVPVAPFENTLNNGVEYAYGCEDFIIEKVFDRSSESYISNNICICYLVKS